MASTFTDLGIEIMATGENAGTWGDKTNTNLNIVNTAIAGYVEQAVTNGGTLALDITDGAATATAQNAVIKLTGTITGNSVVTIPDSIEKTFIVTNGTSGSFTVQFKTVSGTGVTFSTTDKGTKFVYTDGTNINEISSSSSETLTSSGDLTLDAGADIVIDAAGGNVEFKDAGTTQLTLDMDGTAGAQVIQLRVDTDDLIFKQFDGTTVLTLDDDTTVKVATDLTVGDDLSLISDSAVLKFGADGDTSLTHTDGTGLTLNSTNKLCFNDASQFIQGASATVLDIAATDEIELTATLIDVVGNLAGSGTGTFGGILKTDDATDATSTTDGSLQTDGGLSVAKDTIIGNDLKLLSDSAVLVFGAGSDATLTHTNDTGLTLNSTNKLMFNDASQFIQGTSATVLSIGATDEIDLTATAVDLNGTLNVSGVATFQATPVFPDGSLALVDLDIDGGTDIGADIVDADLFIIDDGAGGTNRKTTASRLKTYITGSGSSAAADDITAGDAAVNITTSSGNITIDAAANDSDIILKGTDGGADTTFLTIDGSAAGEATFNAGIVIADAGLIGSASDKDAIAIGSDGDVTLTQDLELQHDGAILSFGANDEVTLTHVHDDGLLLNTDMQLQFRDSAINIRSDADGDLDINADDEIELNSTLIDINGNVEISGTLAQVGVATFTARDIHSGGITIANDGQIGSVGDADSMAISSGGVVTFTQAPVFPDGSLAVADLDIDGATDIGAAIVDADLFIVDDGAGGTNRKVTASRLKTYASGLTGVTTGSGNVTITDGNLVVASGHGIDFAATADLSDGDATPTQELFDDYEEGTWTASITTASGSVGVATSNDECTYVKIGRHVFLNGSLVCASVSSPSGRIEINGKPLNTSGGEGGHRGVGSCMIHSPVSDVGSAIVPMIFESYNPIRFHNGSSGDEISANILDDGAEIRFAINYHSG